MKVSQKSSSRIVIREGPRAVANGAEDSNSPECDGEKDGGEPVGDDADVFRLVQRAHAGRVSPCPDGDEND